MDVSSHTILPCGSVRIDSPLDKEGKVLMGLAYFHQFASLKEECDDHVCGPLPLQDVISFLDG